MTSTLSRREALELLAVAPFVGALPLPPAAAQRGSRFVRELLAAPPGQAYAPKYFTDHEWQTVRVLVDLVIPKDDRSGSATDAAVPEFMDFILVEYPEEQLWMRGGLAWLDTEAHRRFAKDFVSAEASVGLRAVTCPREETAAGLTAGSITVLIAPSAC